MLWRQTAEVSDGAFKLERWSLETSGALLGLDLTQASVEAVVGHQLFVGAPLDDAALLRHEDGVRVADGGEAMGDDDGRLPPYGAITSSESS